MDRATLIAAFNEWDRQYQEDPDGFADAWPADGTYGEACADFLLKLLAAV